MKNTDMTTPREQHPLDDVRATRAIGESYAAGFEAGRQGRDRQARSDEQGAREQGFHDGFQRGEEAAEDRRFSKGGTVTVGPTDPSKLEANFVWLTAWHEGTEVGAVLIDFGDAEGIIERVLREVRDSSRSFDLGFNVGPAHIYSRLTYEAALTLASDLRTAISNEEARREQAEARG